MLRNKLIWTICLLIVLPALAMAQVTTSSITGTIKNQKGETLEGASIIATHLPSGTVYQTTSKKGGSVNLPALRIGGPYQIKVSYVGYKAEVLEDIYLQLGEPFNFNINFTDDVQKSNVTVNTSLKYKTTRSDRIGASTVISQRQLASLPTISRSITDFTRLTPQANGTNFGGRDAHYNNMVVDGANLNNNFGLSTDLLPGGGNPISLDAYDEISVNIAPFDVRQSNFTGAGINAVTKSGTNTFKGSAYYYYRDETFNGKKVKSTDLGTLTPTKNKVLGATFGGPIIKNKLFFFVSYETEEKTTPPGSLYTPKGGSGLGNISNVVVDSLAKLANFLKQTYNYDPGSYDNPTNLATKNTKFLAKIDWNISNVHKLTFKYSDYNNNNDVQVNASSLSFLSNSFTVRNGSSTATISGSLPNNRISLNSLSFGNSNYGFHDVVRSASLELKSNFKGKLANQLLASLTKIRDTRTSPSQVFPFIDIFNNDGKNYMSVGYEPFSYNNDVINDVYSITDNLSYFVGKHTITGGLSYEYQKVGNMFMGGSQSYYAYNSLNDFITNQAPAAFSLTYSLVPGQPAVYSANLKYGQLGGYIQDEINISSNFKLTAGIRFDKPIYPESPIENPAITSLTFPDKNGNPTNYNTGKWPKSTLYWSPRVGFRYDVTGDKSLIVRGGTGIFTGRIPFVWLTNMPTNSGMYQTSQTVNSASALVNYKFNPNPTYYQNTFNYTPGLSTPASFVLVDPNFKFTQIWRSNLAVDKVIAKGWTLTMEALYTKDINAVVMRNANQKAPDATFSGSDSRARYSSTATTARRIYNNISQAVVLENTNKGFSGSFTVGITKTATKGFFGSLAYTYTMAEEVSANPGSTASSVWSGNFNVGTQNSLEMYNSQYAIPHRIVGNISYRAEYARKNMATTVSLFYQGMAQGSTSFIYSNDLNGDGNSSDLMYIPSNPGDISLVTASGTYNGVAYSYTPQQQSDALFQLIQNTPYLKKHKGQYAGRNETFLPWYDRMDAKVLQDFTINVNQHKHTLQVSLDIINFLNLLNRNWGVQQSTVYRNPLTYNGTVDANGRPQFKMNVVAGQLPTAVFQDVLSTSSTWGMQLGVRYLF